jgi:hypothetical protein
VRAPAAAALAAISAILVVLCYRGILPGLGAVAPMTLAFLAACVGVLGATDEETSQSRRRLAIGAIVFAVIVLVVACARLMRAFGA